MLKVKIPMMIFQFQNNPIKGHFLAIFRILKSLTQKKDKFQCFRHFAIFALASFHAVCGKQRRLNIWCQVSWFFIRWPHRDCGWRWRVIIRAAQNRHSAWWKYISETMQGKILLYGTRAAAKSGHNVISRITGAARHSHCFQPSEHLFEIGTKCSKQKKETKNLRLRCSVLYFYWPRNIGGIVSIFSNRGLIWVKIPKYWFASEDQKLRSHIGTIFLKCFAWPWMAFECGYSCIDSEFRCQPWF